MKKWINFSVWVKVSAIITFWSTIVGVAFQKGMLEQMGLGNIRASYQVEEIFSSALRAYLFSSGHIMNIPLSDYAEILTLLILSFVFIGIVKWFDLDKKFTLKFLSTQKEKVDNLKNNRKLSSAALFVFFNGLLGLLAATITFLFKYAIVGIIVTLLLPAIGGYLLGVNYIITSSKDKPCMSATKETMKREISLQCTQISMMGKKLQGRFILENSDGYFFQTKSTFLYIFKNNNSCIYSGYKNKEETDGINPEYLSFHDKHVIDFCENRFSK